MSRAVTFRPSGGLRGIVRVPGDKSITQRALLIGAICDGTMEIVDPLWSGDPLATAGMVERLGVRVEGRERRAPLARVHGAGLRGLRAPGAPLDARNSGTGMRLLAGVLAGQEGRYVLDGDDSLRRRPMGRVVEPLRAMGVQVRARDGGYAPLEIEGSGELRAIHWRSPVASAQVKSCVLLAGLYADGETVVRRAGAEPRSYRAHAAGRGRGGGHAGRRRDACAAPRAWGSSGSHVPGDPSSAAFLVAAALLVPGSDLVIDDVGLNPSRLGFFEVVRRMGADLSWEITADEGGEPRGPLRVRSSRLAATHVPAGEVPALIDEVTLLALLAVFADGETTVDGVADLRAKECDRLAAVVDVVTVTSAARPRPPPTRSPRRPRRRAAAGGGGTSTRRRPSPGDARRRRWPCVPRRGQRPRLRGGRRLVPRFHDDSCGGAALMTVIAIDGPAGSGKSTLARLLSERLGYAHLDTGAMYRAVAYLALREGVALDDGASLAGLARAAHLSFTRRRTHRGRRPRRERGDPSAGRVGGGLRGLGSRRGPRVLLDEQRRIGAGLDVVIEGRDIGTVVFPDAPVKIYLTASADVRAERRRKELIATGEHVRADETLQAIVARDAYDSGRAVAPLRRADDAIELDTSGMGIEQVVEAALEIVGRRSGAPA